VDELPTRAEGRDAWTALMDEIGEVCPAGGAWTSETRPLRDAARITRITKRTAASDHG